MGDSLRQLSDRRTLKGWVVLTKNETFALNYGPTLCGRGWGFDWLNRATVFKSKTAACKAIKHILKEEVRRTVLIVSVSNWAILVPSVNKAGRTVWHAYDKRGGMNKVKDYTRLWIKQANGLLKRAKVLKRAAGRLEAR